MGSNTELCSMVVKEKKEEVSFAGMNNYSFT